MKVLVRIMGDHKREYTLSGTTRVGRALDNTVSIDDHLVSRYHAEIRQTPEGEYEVVDLDSTHGTFVARERISKRVLKNGDEIFVGATRMFYRESTPSTIRRWDERVVCEMPVRMHIEDQETIDTKAKDISLGGMRLSLEQELEPDTSVELEIAFPGTEEPLRVNARVAHRSFFDHEGVGVAFLFKSNAELTELAKRVRDLVMTIGPAEEPETPEET